MTQEEKAKAYDEALERARYWEKQPTVWNPADICQKLFPALIESEDERVRKSLIDFLDDIWHRGKDADFDKYGKADCSDWMAWLEKQAERKPISAPRWMIDFLNEYRGNIGCTLDYDEHKEVDGKILAIITWMESLGPQTRQEWGENEKIRKALIHMIREQDGFLTAINGISVEDIITWLEKRGETSYNPYKATVEAIAEMCERYSQADSDLKDFLDNVKVKCKEAIEYDKMWCGDEEIREEIIEFIRWAVDRGSVTDRQKEKVDLWMAWLGKQERQKPTDKVEPKFKVGDWIVNGLNTVNQVTYVEQLDDKHFSYTLDDGTYFSGSWEDSYHLWTIQDAKDGDVLTDNQNCTCIFREIMTDEDGTSVDAYCGINISNEFVVNEKGEIWTVPEDLFPATKEQRDLLFQKMKEAGYECDAERKELRKIEQKPIWSEEDEQMIQDIIEAIDTQYSASDYKEMVDWLKSLKERVQPQPKQEWSEEDEKMLSDNLLLKHMIG